MEQLPSLRDLMSAVVQHRSPCGWAPVVDRNLAVVGVGGERADMLNGVLHLPVEGCEAAQVEAPCLCE
eukprot:5850631-Pyramimonas_sp.AAC.1